MAQQVFRIRINFQISKPSVNLINQHLTVVLTGCARGLDSWSRPSHQETLCQLCLQRMAECATSDTDLSPATTHSQPSFITMSYDVEY